MTICSFRCADTEALYQGLRPRRFRNIEATPDDPVETWGVEGVATAIERGSLPHWATITRADGRFAKILSTRPASRLGAFGTSMPRIKHVQVVDASLFFPSP